MKHCKRCGADKPLEDFHKDKKAKDGLCFYCKECNKKKTRDYYAGLDKTAEKARNQQRVASGAHRDYQYKKKYGLSLEDYNLLLEKQGGKCVICGITREECNDKRALPVDHDHSCCPGVVTCGKCVRGILCHSCNRAVGLMRDNSERLRKAAAYLEQAANPDVRIKWYE